MDLFLRWAAADPVGDTVLAKTSEPSKAASQTLVVPENHVLGSSQLSASIPSAKSPAKSNVESRLPLIEITNTQSKCYPTVSPTKKLEPSPKPSSPSKQAGSPLKYSTPSKKVQGVSKKASGKTKTFKTPVKAIPHVREARRRYSDTDLSKVCL